MPKSIKRGSITILLDVTRTRKSKFTGSLCSEHMSWIGMMNSPSPLLYLAHILENSLLIVSLSQMFRLEYA